MDGRSREERADEVFAGWLERQEDGEAESVEEILAANPDLADALRDRLSALPYVDVALHASPEHEAPTTPAEIGDFRIVREIGRGGMGVVYEAEQVSMRRRVALKVLSVDLTTSPKQAKRFAREARAAGRLQHTNIVPVYAMGRWGPYWYYAMELVRGRPLSDVVEDMESGTPPEVATRSTGADAPAARTTSAHGRSWYAHVAEMFAGVADALGAAHEAGVVHRDVKPSNLLLDGESRLKIVDFGLARLEDGGPAMTITGDILGTPMYMSPEQARARRDAIDHRTDIYSLGATLYEVVTRRPPFRGETLQELCTQIITKDPARPRAIDVHLPRDLETIVLKAMEKDPDRRYQSGAAMARDLQRFALGDPVRARRIGPVERTWRKVRRHKLVSGLALSTAVLAIVGAVLWAAAGRESDRRRALEYDRLLARAEEEMSASHEVALDEESPGVAGSEGALGLLDQAIELVPERPDAWWLRCLVPGRAFSLRWEDVETAGRLGLPRQTWRMTRAHLLEQDRRYGEADAERARAAAERRTPESAYFEGVLLARRNRHAEAERCLTEALMEAGGSRHLRYLVHRRRAGVYEGLRDFAAALHDLRSLQELGFDPLSVRVRIAYLERRMGRSAVADRRLEAVLDEVRAEGSAATWADACAHLRRTGVAAWREKATAEALAAHPHHPGVQAERVLALKDAERAEEALPLAEAAAAEHPEDHAVRSALAQLHFAAGRHAESARGFDRSLALEPDCLGCLLGKGRAHYELGDLDAAIACWRRAIEVEPRASVGYYHLALDYAETGRIDEAEAAYRRAVELNATDAMSLNGLANLLLHHREDREGALVLTARCLRLQPQEAGFHLTRGNVLMHLARWDEAKAAFEQALALDPSFVEATVNLGIVHLQDPAGGETALACFRKGVAEDPDDAHHHLLLTSALRKLDREEEAIEHARRAVALAPDDARCQGRLASLLLFASGDREGARTAVDRALSLPDPPAEAYVVRASLRGSDAPESMSAALADYRKAAEIDPTEPDAQRGVGYALLRLGRPAEALEALTRARDLDAKHAWGHVWLGQSLHALGRDDEALAALDEGLEALPADLVLLEAKALLLARDLHRPRDALAVLTEAQEHHPEAWRVPFNRAVLLFELGRPDEATAALLRVEEAAPQDPQRPYERAEMLLHHGRWKDARDGFERAIAMRPAWDRPRYGLLHLLTETGAYEELLGQARAAFDLVPANPYVRFTLVRALRATGRTEEAAERARAFAEEIDADRLRWPYDHYVLAAAGDDESLRPRLPPTERLGGGDLYMLAVVHAVRGDDDAVVRALDACIAGGYRRLPSSVHDRELRTRTDPRVAERLRRLGE